MPLARQADQYAPIGTPLPLSADVEESRPEIGGSFGGFIAVVIFLVVIFLSSCIGIFILLRNHDPTSHERRARRARARDRDFSAEAPIGPPGIRERLARLFGRREGWVKASEGEDQDEWDASDDRIPNPFHSLRERDRAHDQYPASFASRPSAQDVARNMSADSIEVELNAPSAAYYNAPSISPGTSLLQSEHDDEGSSSIHMAPVSSPVSQVPQTTVIPAPEHARGPSAGQDERHFSVPAGTSWRGEDIDGGRVRSMQKFENGTKFKESL
ncbi:hypothetical protein VTO73DRAFT_14190 [Trametes versicolor]